MSDSVQLLSKRVQERFGGILQQSAINNAELTIQVPREKLHEVCLALRDETGFSFEMLIDLCGVDYLEYESTETNSSRYAVVYQLLSIKNNQRIRLKIFLDNDVPRLDSVIDIWASANWYEREAFDLFGILFDNHPDLRRLLTDYGFIGHPFRKDFPLIGNVEMRYDPELKRVIYQPVSIEPRINVPRIVRDDHRYISNAGLNTGAGE